MFVKTCLLSRCIPKSFYSLYKQVEYHQKNRTMVCFYWLTWKFDFLSLFCSNVRVKSHFPFIRVFRHLSSHCSEKWLMRKVTFQKKIVKCHLQEVLLAILNHQKDHLCKPKTSSGLSIEPCGTAALTNAQFDSRPLRDIFWYRLLRKLWKRLRRSPDIPTVSTL